VEKLAGETRPRTSTDGRRVTWHCTATVRSPHIGNAIPRNLLQCAKNLFVLTVRVGLRFSARRKAPAERCRSTGASTIYQDSSGQKLSSVHDRFITIANQPEARCTSPTAGGLEWDWRGENRAAERDHDQAHAGQRIES